MARMFGHAELVEKNLTATAELATAKARITELETELAALKAASADGPVQITQLTEQINDLTSKLSAKDVELAAVRTDLEKAKATANAVIAAQGLTASALPHLDPNPNPAAGSDAGISGTLTEQCLKAKKKK